MMEAPRHTRLCTSVISLRVALEKVNNTDVVAMPAWLARKLVRDAEALNRQNAPLLFAAALIIPLLALSVFLSQCRMARDATHEPAHRGEVL